VKLYKSMVHVFHKDLAICIHNNNAPLPEEWALFMKSVSHVHPARLRMVVFTDGGAPTTLQRGEYTDYLKGNQAPMAIVSGNIAARGVGTALSWFNRQLKVFLPKKLGAALTHARVPESEHATLLEQIRTLSTSLIGPIRCVDTATL
jgi:hypothetical protein